MRWLCAFLLVSSLWVLPSALGGEGAGAAQFIRPSSESERPFVLEATFVCGMSDGHFGCRQTPGAVIHGKNATPGVDDKNLPDGAAEGTAGEQATTAPAGSPGQGPQSGGAAQEVVQPGEHACPPGYKVLAAPNARGGYCEPPGTPEAVNTACEHGMVGAPPNCHCPQNSELLGGNCVHYTETCRVGLAADFTPQPCAGADEKLACKMRQDGLKDCCCLTYDKL
jgi:hypothetical protein